MILVLTNNFHNTEVRVRIDSIPGLLTAAQVARATKKLCGMSDCTCGGIRGPQYGPDGQRLSIEYYTPESYRVEEA